MSDVQPLFPHCYSVVSARHWFGNVRGFVCGMLVFEKKIVYILSVNVFLTYSALCIYSLQW